MNNRKPIPKNIRKLVYEKYDGHCAYCGCLLHYDEMQVDHIDSVWHSELNNSQSNNEIDNLMPSCRMCNFYKGACDIEGFRKRIVNELIPNLQRTFNYRMAEKYGIIKLDTNQVTFYFEKNN